MLEFLRLPSPIWVTGFPLSSTAAPELEHLRQFFSRCSFICKFVFLESASSVVEKFRKFRRASFVCCEKCRCDYLVYTNIASECEKIAHSFLDIGIFSPAKRLKVSTLTTENYGHNLCHLRQKFSHFQVNGIWYLEYFRIGSLSYDFLSSSVFVDEISIVLLVFGVYSSIKTVFERFPSIFC